MKVGILSMHRVVNNGSFLQAFALKRMIEEYGHQVYFVDFDAIGQSEPIQGWKEKLKSSCPQIYYIAKKALQGNQKAHMAEYQRQFAALYRKECWPLLGIGAERNYDTTADIIVFGSDEIFNAVQYVELANQYVWELYGENFHAGKKISYAASCGYTTIDGIKKYGMAQKTEELLRDFSGFSVRDKNTQEFIEYFTGRKAVINADPVIVYDFPEVEIEKPEMENYILIYAYPGRIHAPEEIQAIKDFARKHGKRIISVNLYQGWEDEFILAHPFELLGWFKYADYVVTDTFHGAVLSIKYGKQFAAFIRESNRQKLGYVLQMFGVEERQVQSCGELEGVLLKKIPLIKLQERILEEKERAKNYLSGYLRG